MQNYLLRESILEFPPIGARTCLYQTAELDDVLDRMVWQAAGFLSTKERIMIVGILRRGAPLAEMMHTKLMQLDRDLANIHEVPGAPNLRKPAFAQQRHEHVPVASELRATSKSRTVLVVDDVMFKGHSMLRAVEYLARKQASEIRTAVLVDRGANKLPVRVDISGVRLDVAPTDIIECNVPPFEMEFKIDLLMPTIN